MTETFKPSKGSIAGILAKDIDSTWTKVLPLSKALLSREAQRYLETIPYGIHLSLDGDFNEDRIADRAIVGVYEGASGEKGRFVLILTREASRAWKKVFLGKHEGTSGFSYITSDGSTLGWSECFECDAGEGIVWTKEKGYQFEVVSDEESGE